MKTEMFVENFRLDVSAEISTLLNFAIDDIKDFSSRSTTWSKTIVLPGTQNNNKLFGHIFQIGQSNEFNNSLDNVGYNFNASKAADCIIFQDQMQTFKGVLRLMQINITKGEIEYEVAVFGELAGLNVKLSGALLEDLDFSQWDHVYNETNIVDSWNNTSVDVYYPLIDHGTYSPLKHDWDIRTFRPALHVWEYIDAMFIAAGFRYSSALFDTLRFRKLIVPHNQRYLYSTASNYLNANSAGETVTNFFVFRPNYLNIVEINAFSPTDANNDTFNYDDPTTITVRAGLVMSGTYYSTLNPLTIKINAFHGAVTVEVASVVLPATPNTTLVPFSISISGDQQLDQNDDIYTQVVHTAAGADQINIVSAVFTLQPQAGQSVQISVGGNVVMNNMIPKNVRQIDFLLGIVKLFNLYVYESLNDPKLIFIKPYIDFYSTDSTDSVNWTYKLNRDKAIRIKPMSELNAKKYEFKYKPDSDFFNEAYRKRYGQGYGDYTFDSEFEFAEQTKAFEILFSATPLVGYSGEDKVFSTIFKQSNENEETIDSNIRILQSKKITGVSSWDILDGVSVLDSLTEYGYAGHFDDPDVPSNDLNFGALRELFFILVSGDLTRTQFNLYWSSYMAEITDKDSKLLNGFFYLTAKDILSLDFSKKVFVDGVLYRLNAIKDYNASTSSDCEAELLKINYLIY